MDLEGSARDLEEGTLNLAVNRCASRAVSRYSGQPLRISKVFLPHKLFLTPAIIAQTRLRKLSLTKALSL